MVTVIRGRLEGLGEAGCKLHCGRHQQSHKFRSLPVVAVLQFVVYIFGFRVLWVCLKKFCRSKSGCLQSKAACIGPSLGESRQARLLLMPSSTTAQLAALRLAADILDSHSTILSYSRVALQLLQEPAPYC
ncbi:uncharacterized protein LOC144103544 [Amblyomma americanum]